jgi:hypothetical protein
LFFKAELPSFSQGVLEFPIRKYKMTVKMKSSISSFDQPLYDTVTKNVTEIPTNASIMDFSRVDSDGMPFVASPLPNNITQDIAK